MVGFRGPIAAFALVLSVSPVVLVCACSDPSRTGVCEPGTIYCEANIAVQCLPDAVNYQQTDCLSQDQICHPGLGCVVCRPGTYQCIEHAVGQCRPDGSGADVLAECEVEQGQVCFWGACVDACEAAAEQRSYIGCEYWAVDLDNAKVSESEVAAAQQYAVAISNVGLIDAHVTVTRNDAPLGWPPEEVVVAEADVIPDGLHVFQLPPREVDGSPDGEFDTGTHTHLSSRAYKVVSNVPIVAYQFNPLENVQVFSNDASILIPTSALDNRYIVMGWPQTIADTDEPQTDWNMDLRAFLTVVGSEPGTDVNIKLAVDIVGSPEVPARLAGDTFTVTMGPYDVLNLETAGFNADFTGTEVWADKPVAVFSGSEASDVPYFESLSYRRCCADHLEHQLYPESAAGTQYVAAVMPLRTPPVRAAGADVSIVEEPEFFRILGLMDGTVVQTTLSAPDDVILLDRGEHVTLKVYCDFVINSSKPVFVGQFVASQMNTGIDLQLPGSDPSFVMVPPVEQWRHHYVFLTPDKYAFDFMMVVAPEGTELSFDLTDMPPSCTVKRAECSGHPDPTTPMMVWRCQLSFPIIDESLPAPDNVIPNDQNDGYHILEASEPVELIVYGFDSHVSYAYAGGTDIRRINVE